MKNQTIVNLRKAYQHGVITIQEYNTLKGQCLSGRERSAAKGLMTILKRYKIKNEKESVI